MLKRGLAKRRTVLARVAFTTVKKCQLVKPTTGLKMNTAPGAVQKRETTPKTSTWGNVARMRIRKHFWILARMLVASITKSPSKEVAKMPAARTKMRQKPKMNIKIHAAPKIRRMQFQKKARKHTAPMIAKTLRSVTMTIAALAQSIRSTSVATSRLAVSANQPLAVMVRNLRSIQAYPLLTIHSFMH